MRVFGVPSSRAVCKRSDQTLTLSGLACICARTSAIARMRTALTDLVVGGIKVNIPLLLIILGAGVFEAGGQNIHYLETKLGLKH